MIDYIRLLVISVGQKCNLRCRACGSMTPFAPNEFKRYEPLQIVYDAKLVFERIKKIGTIQLQGGEPFLYPELGKLITMLMPYVPEYERIVIATNGSIVPSDELLQIIKKNGIIVRISDYPIIREQQEKLEKILDKKDVKHYYSKFTSGQSLWYYKGSFEMNRQNDDHACRRRFDQCKNKHCLTLERSVLSHCTRSSNAYVIQGFERSKDDYIVVDARDTFEEELTAYIQDGKFMEACRFCYGTDEEHLCAPAEQL